MTEGKKVNAQVATDEETRDALFEVLDGIVAKGGGGMSRGQALRVLVESAEAKAALDDEGSLADDVVAIQRACGTIGVIAQSMSSKYRQSVSDADMAAQREVASLKGRVGELEGELEAAKGELAKAKGACREAQEEAERQRAAAERAQATLDAVLGLKGESEGKDE